jgi:hypothetical protein
VHQPAMPAQLLLAVCGYSLSDPASGRPASLSEQAFTFQWPNLSLCKLLCCMRLPVWLCTTLQQCTRNFKQGCRCTAESRAGFCAEEESCRGAGHGAPNEPV